MTFSHRQQTLDHCQPQMEAAFSVAEYKDRLNRVRARMAEDGIDLLWTQSPEGQCYLSGFQAEWYMGHSPMRWPACSGVAVHVDFDHFIYFDTVGELVLSRYASVSSDTRIFPYKDPNARRDGIAFIMDELKAAGWLKQGTRVGQEAWSIRPVPAVYRRFTEAFEGAGGVVSDASRILREVRWIKSPAEIACIERAGSIADVGIRAVREALYPGASELEIYGQMIAAMAAAGGENPGITQPVLSGPKSNCGHALASRKQIVPGENVNIDICGVFNRYHANMARSYWMGTPPDHICRFYEKVEGVFDAIRPILKPNLPVRELNRVAREYFTEQGIWDEGAWLGGYEMGISFPPDWVGNYVYEYHDTETTDVFEPGTAVNFEAVFYMPDMAGITHLIDTIVFKWDDARLLSQEPYGLSTIAI